MTPSAHHVVAVAALVVGACSSTFGGVDADQTLAPRRGPVLATGAPPRVTMGAELLPVPTAFWRFQEPAGQPRVSEGRYKYSLVDSDTTHPVRRSGQGEGLFGL
jgi:hypothetical protein